MNAEAIGVRIPAISRFLGLAVRRSQVSLGVAALVLLSALGGQASAAAGGTGAPETEDGGRVIPFTFADVGWVIVGVAVLIALLLTLQLLARRPTRKLARAPVRQDATSP